MICVKCRLDMPLSRFYRDANSPSGYRRLCKVCSGERKKAVKKRWDEVRRIEEFKIKALTSDPQKISDHLASCKKMVMAEMRIKIPKDRSAREFMAEAQAKNRKERPFTRDAVLQYLSDGELHRPIDVRKYFGVSRGEMDGLLFVITMENGPLCVNGSRVVLAEEDDGRLFLWKPFEEVSA